MSKILAITLFMLKFGLNKKPYDFLEEIATRHRTLRKQAGFSQSELAKRSGVSLGSLKRFETTGQISLEALLKLAELLNHLDDFDLILKPVDNFEEIEKLFSDKMRA